MGSNRESIDSAVPRRGEVAQTTDEPPYEYPEDIKPIQRRDLSGVPLATVPAVVLTPEMRRKLAAAGKRERDAKQARDQLIREALAAGASLREVGDAVGLTHPAVKLIGEKG